MIFWCEQLNLAVFARYCGILYGCSLLAFNSIIHGSCFFCRVRAGSFVRVLTNAGTQSGNYDTKNMQMHRIQTNKLIFRNCANWNRWNNHQLWSAIKLNARIGMRKQKNAKWMCRIGQIDGRAYCGLRSVLMDFAVSPWNLLINMSSKWFSDLCPHFHNFLSDAMQTPVVHVVAEHQISYSNGNDPT